MVVLSLDVNTKDKSYIHKKCLCLINNNFKDSFEQILQLKSPACIVTLNEIGMPLREKNCRFSISSHYQASLIAEKEFQNAARQKAVAK